MFSLFLIVTATSSLLVGSPTPHDSDKVEMDDSDSIFTMPKGTMMTRVDQEDVFFRFCVPKGQKVEISGMPFILNQDTVFTAYQETIPFNVVSCEQCFVQMNKDQGVFVGSNYYAVLRPFTLLLTNEGAAIRIDRFGGIRSLPAYLQSMVFVGKGLEAFGKVVDLEKGTQIQYEFKSIRNIPTRNFTFSYNTIPSSFKCASEKAFVIPVSEYANYEGTPV